MMGRRNPVGFKSEQFIIGSTSLPPKIDGQLRRHVVLEIPFVKWLNKCSIPNVCVTVLWWGEEGKGTIFRPAHDENKNISKKFNRAIYDLLSGPKQFAEYLNAMKVMQLNIFNENDSLLIGQAQVKNLSSLSSSRSISGMYPVVNKQNKKIAEIKVCLSIISLQSQGNAEVPTPDGGLNPVEDSDLFLNDFERKHGALDALECFNPSNVNNLNSQLEVNQRIDVDPSHAWKDSSEDVADLIVSFLEKLKSEMMNSCEKVDILSSIEPHQIVLPPIVPRSSTLTSVQPVSFILNSILGDDINNPHISSEDKMKLLEHDDLYDFFYRNVPNLEENKSIEAKSKKISKEYKAPSKSRTSGNITSVHLSTKLKQELSQASGVLVVVNSFTLMTNNKQFVKDVQGDRGISSDCLLVVSIYNLFEVREEMLIEMKPILVKSKGRALQFNQKVVINKMLLNLNDEHVPNVTIQFKLIERYKHKCVCCGKFSISELLLSREECPNEPMKLHLNDKLDQCVGSLEVGIKMLFNGRENLVVADEKQNAVKKVKDNGHNFLQEVPMYACLIVPHGEIFVTNSKKDMEIATLVVRTQWSEKMMVKVNIGEEMRIPFNLTQVYSVSLSKNLLNNMQNNYVIIEIWTSSSSHKKTKQFENQLLVGFSKLPINTFFQSFISEDSYRTSTKSIFPVVAADGSIPIVCPSTGESVGVLRVVLAMGTYNQVLHLQNVKTIPHLFHGSVNPLTSPEFEKKKHPMQPIQVEHTLEVHLESFKNILLKIQEEKGHEYFVQFQFPDLQDEKFQTRHHQTSWMAGGRNIKFNESFQQLVVLPNDVPLCWHICKAYSINKLHNEVSFQLWSRNFSSQRLVAKGVLVLNEFLQVLDGKLPGDTKSSSEFLVEMFNPSNDAQCVAGIMKIRISHSSSVKDNTAIESIPSVPHACLSVHVSRLCGLKYAAQLLKDLEPQMNWSSSPGFNTFLSVSFSILGQTTNTKNTRIVSGSFRPDFNTHFEFVCPLSWSSSSTLSEKYLYLTNIFEKSYLDIGVCCTSNEEGDDVNISSKNNILIGKVRINLYTLVTKHSDLRGWLAVESPLSCKERNVSKHVVGGIEVDVRFSPHGDLESILEEGRKDGWSHQVPPPSVPVMKWQTIQLRINNISFPIESFLGNDSSRNTPARCYITYKFFDKETVFSESFPLDSRDGIVQVDMNYVGEFQIDSSPTFDWYLMEEKLEIQVWISYRKSEREFLVEADDEYVGSGYISLVELKCFTGRKCISSGYCPLFNASSDYLGAASLHYNFQVSGSKEEPDEAIMKIEKNQRIEDISEEEHFLARVVVERAYHLPGFLEKRIRVLPNAYVTFETSKSHVRTEVIEGDCDPLWNYESNVWLSKRLFNVQGNNLMFKVWHKNISCLQVEGDCKDSFVGFASVDLKPLLTKMFQSISGFYNIISDNGCHQGEIKVSITPLQNVFSLPNQLDYRELGGGECEINSSELNTKNITDALEALTTKLKQKMSQYLDFQFTSTSDPSNELNSNHNSQQHLIDQNFNENQAIGGNSPNIYVQNYNFEQCECDDLEGDVLRETFSSNEMLSFHNQDHFQTIPVLNFTEKYVQTDDTPDSINDKETFPDDLHDTCNTFKETNSVSGRSSPFTQTSESDPSDRKHGLMVDWLSEHKRKVSQRIVAFKSFKVPSIGESERIAKILSSKLK